MRGLILAAATLVCIGCVTPTRSTLAPRTQRSAEAMEAEAIVACRDRRGVDVTPPHAFTTDGCSAWPDGDWVDCCIEHDFAYWCGGTAQDRAQADDDLASCVASVAPQAASIMWLGVRMGGAPWIPAAWRWGYGWDYPAGYARNAPPADAR